MGYCENELPCRAHSGTSTLGISPFVYVYSLYAPKESKLQCVNMCVCECSILENQFLIRFLTTISKERESERYREGDQIFLQTYSENSLAKISEAPVPLKYKQYRFAYLELLFKKQIYFFGCIRSQLQQVGSVLHCVRSLGAVHGHCSCEFGPLECVDSITAVHVSCSVACEMLVLQPGTIPHPLHCKVDS